MERLRAIPEDCTFNQTEKIDQIRDATEKGCCYCYDLSSATDRFPAILTRKILDHVLDEKLAIT
jgi:hypothetical protein